MCYPHNELQAYLDLEVTQRKRWEMEVHIEGCAECRKVLEELSRKRQFAAQLLNGYEGNLQTLRPDVDAAWQQLAVKYHKPKDNRFTKGAEMIMNRYSKVAAALVVVAALVTLLSFGSVRSSLAEWLQIFRVEKVETVTISQRDIAELEKAMETGAEGIDIESFGKIDVSGTEELKEVNFADAKNAVDFDLKVPEAIDGYGTPTIKAQSPMTMSLTLNVANVNAMIKTLGSDKPLPEEIDGKTITVSIPAMIVADYPSAAPDGTGITVGQSRGPQIAVPEDIDVNSIRDSLLSLEMLPDELRDRLAAVNDWQHTMLIPNIEGSSREVKVNGRSGVFVTDPGQGESEVKDAALIWPDNGVINAVQGSLTLEQALAIAASMK